MTFADKRTAELFTRGVVKGFPPDVLRRAVRKLEYVDLASRLEDHRTPPGNRLHALKGDRAGQHAIAVNDQWQICSRLLAGEPTMWSLRLPLRSCGEHSQYTPAEAAANAPWRDAAGRFHSGVCLTVAGLAAAVRVSRQSIDELLRGRRAVSPGMALRLSRLFGNSAGFWLNAQRAVDLWDGTQAIKDDVAQIKPLRVA